MNAGRRTLLAAALAAAACGDEAKPSPKPDAPPPVAQATPAPVAPTRHDVAPLLEACKRECVEAFRMQDPDERLVLDRLKTAATNPTADDAEWARLTAAVERIRARNARLKADPRFLESEKKANWIRENPTFRGVELTRLFADPFVIFQEVKHIDPRDTERVHNEKQGVWEEVPKDGTSNPMKAMQNAAWTAKADALAKRDAALLLELHRRFRELFADEFRLPTLAEKGRMLTGLVMWNRASFDALLKEAGQPVSPTIRALYSQPQQEWFTYVGDDSIAHEDERPVADGGVQKASDGALLHAAVGQLLHEYAAIARGKPLSDADQQAIELGPTWLRVGLAEFLSAVETDVRGTGDLSKATWRHERIALDRIEAAQRSRENAERWTLAELTKETSAAAREHDTKRLDEGEPQMSSLFAGRAWAFVHFLWNYDRGKYRPKLLAFVRESLVGTAKSGRFATSLGCSDAEHWGLVEREFDWYWEQLLDRDVGRKPSGEWETPSTDAPTGRVEDDEAFRDAWNKKHAGK